ncbi:MAG: S-layer homology domain-containing protein, partial [Oscillospiraceae bacterium]
ITKVNADDDITITAANAVYDNANVGTGKAITLGALSISGTAADWYDVTAPTNVTGTITAKPVTVKADDKSMTTGGTLPTFTVTYTGFVGTENDSNAALTTPAVATCTADGKTAGTFDITLSTQAALNDTIGKNYTIASQTTGTLTVSSPSSGGGTVTPPVPKPEPPKTDPGTGNTEVSVPVKPVTKGDTSSATVPEKSVSDAIAAAEKEAAKTGGSSSVTISVDAPEGAKTVETTLPSKSLSAVADGKTDGLKISTPVADLSFDSEALKNIAGMAGKDVKISATQVDTTALTDAQKSQVGDAPVFDFTVTSGDKTISNFNGGTATVSVPYTPKEGENPEFVTVWLLDDAGKLIPIEAKYKDGKIAFETGHFSRYAIGYLPFTDVKADWAYESIVYAYQNQLFSGVGENKFAPTDNMNRAMLWTVLYRMAGSPNQTENPANWYADAQAWAMAEKISDGTNPDGNITREQLATILFRYAKAAATAADMSGFTDTSDISGFAKDGMSWAVESRILQGNSGKLNPAGNATRAEVAAMLQRFAGLSK